MKWISQQSSELSLGVRIPPGAHEKAYLYAFVGDSKDFLLFYKVKSKNTWPCNGRIPPGAPHALIVQWIGRKIPDLLIEVRLLMGALSMVIKMSFITLPLCLLNIRILLKNVDNYVSNVYKGHC